MDPEGKHITVVGLGKTGQAMAQFLYRRGAKVTVTDSAPEADLGEAPARLRGMGVCLELGGHGEKAFKNVDLIALSPGVPHTIWFLKEARNSGIPVMGEIELASRFIDTFLVAVTGTNGKSTVTRLTAEMLEKSGKKVFVGGNLGTPLISYADSGMDADVAVAEISSFQLDTVETFRPEVGVLLNITADHLDRYPSLYAYGVSKAGLFKRQKSGDTAVINAADPLIMELTKDIPARRCSFNAERGTDCGAWFDKDSIYINPAGSRTVKISYSDIPLVGRHNHENVAAAALAAFAAGATRDGVREGVRKFKPDPHRLQWVASINGVDYYDDSKATNVDAVCRAVEAVKYPAVLILGGRDKGGGYGGLKEPVRRRVKALVLLGEAADTIEKELGGIVETRRAGSMDEAVRQAGMLSVAGGTVLLSPACSSFDMYEDYARRGEDFQRAVNTPGNHGNGK